MDWAASFQKPNAMERLREKTIVRFKSGEPTTAGCKLNLGPLQSPFLKMVVTEIQVSATRR